VRSLLERDSETAALLTAVEQARAGSGSLLLLGGEAGIGKTALVRQLLDHAHGTLPCWVAACEPLSVPAPLAPVRDVLAAAGADPAVERDTDRWTLVRRLLAAIGNPSLVVLEDVHWADGGTLDVVRMLASRVGPAGVAVVATYRDDELDAHPELGLLLGDLVGRPEVRRLAPRPLSAAAVGQLAGERVADADLSELVRVTGGNPLLVVESLSQPGELPASVREMTLARTRRLGSDARGLLDAAAVIGGRVPVHLLAQVAPHDEPALDECVAAGVLVADGLDVAFRHELIRRAVEDAVAPVRRRALHGAAVDALAAEPATSPALLAHHAEAAGRDDLVLAWATAAAHEADRLGSQVEAVRQYQRAAAHAPAGSIEEVELQVGLGRSLWMSGRETEAVDLLAAAAAAAEVTGDARLRGRALEALSSALWATDRFDESLRVQEQAVLVIEDTDDVAAKAEAYAGLVAACAVCVHPQRALEIGPTAVSLAAQAGREDLAIDVTISLALAAGQVGDNSGLAVLRDRLADARRLGLTRQSVRCCVNSVWVASMNRVPAVVDEMAPVGLALFEQLQVPHPRDDVCSSLARSMLDRGRFDEAIEWARAARRTPNLERGLATAVDALGRLRRGDASGAAVLDEALETVRASVDVYRVPLVRAAAAEAAWLRGDPGSAAEHVAVGLAVAGLEQSARASGDVVLWAHRSGRPVADLSAYPHLPEAVRREVTGDWRGAIAAWRAVEAPYDAALAALSGDDAAASDAVATLRRLGASAAARAFARDRAAQGRRSPRGPRSSTLDDPAGLTAREREVLELVATGATNPEVAARLYLSERTVAHHVSAVLRKLDSPTRTAAVTRARELGLLPGPGPDAAPKMGR
jgi:DNA-binding CsgD family transcriptional regulator/tetratricopeptide (TPR) repeat protein